MGDKKKRIRSANFTSREKKFFLEITSKYKDVIENKKIDGNTKLLKDQIWRKITDEFNSSSSEFKRSTECLKGFYYNYKKRKRAFEKRLRRSTEDETSCGIKTNDPLSSLMNFTETESDPCSIENHENDGSFDKTPEIKTELWDGCHRPFLEVDTDEDVSKTKKEIVDLQLLMLEKQYEDELERIAYEKQQRQIKKERETEKFHLEKELLMLEIEIKKRQLEKLEPTK